MADMPSSTDDVKAQAHRLYQEASPWIERLARLGYAAYGVVYLVIGILAAQAALGGRGQPTGTKGALYTILRQPFGQGLLSLVALGLLGYSGWRFVQALKDPEQEGRTAAGVSKRLGYFLSGVIHASLSLAAIGMVTGAAWGGDGEEAKGWTARLMALPWGSWLVGLTGAGILGGGLHQLYQAWRVQLDKELVLSHLSSGAQHWIVRFGRLGLAARGVVFGVTGGSLIVAAVRASPNEARGLADALQTLHDSPYGPGLLGGVGLGLVAYGLYQFVAARYRRIHPA
jgi:hypothetical protein